MKQEGAENTSRVKLSDGEQTELIKNALKVLQLSEYELARRLGVHRRTFNDWKREQSLIPYVHLRLLCSMVGCELPRRMEIRDRYWYVNKGAKKGWETVRARYGRIPVDEDFRKKKWHEWWERTGKFRRSGDVGGAYSISEPRYSSMLAEFTGVMIGDGGMMKNYITISMDREADREYVIYLEKMLRELFHVPVSLRNDPKSKCVHLTVYRTALVTYCNVHLGLCIGDKLKQNLDIPLWVHGKRSYAIACLRGLIDTDGCVFYERHRINGKLYSYPRLNFVTASPDLARSVMMIFKDLGYNPRLRRYGRAVQLEKKIEIEHYFKAIGSSNPKHVRRLLAG